MRGLGPQSIHLDGRRVDNPPQMRTAVGRKPFGQEPIQAALGLVLRNHNLDGIRGQVVRGHAVYLDSDLVGVFSPSAGFSSPFAPSVEPGFDSPAGFLPSCSVSVFFSSFPAPASGAGSLGL